MRRRWLALSIVVVVALALVVLLRGPAQVEIARRATDAMPWKPAVEASAPSPAPPKATRAEPNPVVVASAGEAPKATLVGTVRDSATQLTVETCEVHSSLGDAACDHDGRFVLGPVVAGEVPLEVASAHHVARHVVALLAPGAHSEVDVSLDPSATVRGVVRGPDHQPFAKALVQAFAVRVSGGAGPEASTSTDARGRFLLEGVARGRVAVVASAPGYAEARVETVVSEGGESEVALELSTGGAIAGTLVDAKGSAVSGASIAAARTSDRAVVARDTSSADGSFRLDGLGEDSYTVTAEVGGLRALAPGVRVRAREETDVALRLGGDFVGGFVKDESGRAIAGASVRAVSSYAADDGGSTTATATDGSFRIDGLAGAPYRVVATKGESAAEKRGVAAGAAVELVLPATGRLEGTVVDANGRAVEDVSLRVFPTDATNGTSGRAKRSSLLAPGGRFEFELPVGRYEVRAASREAPEGSAEVEIKSGGTTEVTLTLPLPVSVRGVVDSERGPEVGCRVTAVEGASEFVETPDDPAMRETTSGDDGAFTLSPLPPGRVAVRAWCPDHSSGFAWARVDSGSAAVTVRTRPDDDDDGLDFGGIGATLGVTREGQAVIRSLVPDGPAYEAGLVPGDVIVAVDGGTVLGASLQAIVDRVRGPAGTPVTLAIEREGTTFTTVVERRRIALP